MTYLALKYKQFRITHVNVMLAHGHSIMEGIADE
jgi:hypothetical protein